MRKIFSMNKLKNKSVPKIRILSMAVSLSVLLSMVPNHSAFAAGSDRFVTAAKANHWGRSDMRAYLNNGLADVAEDGTVSNKNYGLDSTAGAYASDNSSGYAKQFSDAEYALVQPFTYSTNVLNDNGSEAAYTYTTTDKFWLPGGNCEQGNNEIISWGSEDISASSQYSQTTQNDKQRIIPVSYWSYGGLDKDKVFLRSPYNSSGGVLATARGGSVNYSSMNGDSCAALAVAFKIDLSTVNFASAASAKNIVENGTEGVGTIAISPFEYFGKKTPISSVDYGMYLKTSSGNSFTPTGLSLSSTDKNLTVNYSGGAADQYVVVQVFGEDSLINGTRSYVAAKKLVPGETSTTINVTEWYLSSLDGYTVKVWMEDGSGSLAKATEPVTFYGNRNDISNTGDERKNPRVFAMKADLQTSWGDLSRLSDGDYNKVISGNTSDANYGVMGANATNQKIYFGSQGFWIAGRETAANGGAISADGNVMTLYQVEQNEKRAFNASTDNYKETITVSLQDNQSVAYSGSQAVYSGIVTGQDAEGNALAIPEDKLAYQHSADGGITWTDGMPTDAGVYKTEQ